MVAKNKPSAKAQAADFEDDEWEKSGEGWETVGSENGECIDWADNPRFQGIYLGPGTTTKKATGEVFEIYRYENAAGEKCFAWATFQLDEAMEDCQEGDMVRIVWKGKREIRDGAQMLNVFAVQRRDAS